MKVIIGIDGGEPLAVEVDNSIGITDLADSIMRSIRSGTWGVVFHLSSGGKLAVQLSRVTYLKEVRS